MSEKKKETAGSVAFGCLVPVVLILCSPPLHGFVLSKMWAWFVAPTFGLPMLSMVQALGLSATLCALRPMHVPEEKDDDLVKRGVVLLSRHLGAPLLVLGYGWVLSRFL